ncbi:MAG TPA: hypothetical protein VMT54_13930 [Candidatus Cybelea sp.]|nr:hypothetical protein [Candidatus Cybelea sp.]
MVRRAFLIPILRAALFWALHATAFADAAASPNAEISLWYEIQNSQEPKDFRTYLERFPEGAFVELAANRLAILDPNGPKVALDKVAPLTPDVMPLSNLSLLDFAFWDTIKASRNPADYKAYLHKFPRGVYRDRVKSRLWKLEPGQPFEPDATQP